MFARRVDHRGSVLLVLAALGLPCVAMSCALQFSGYGVDRGASSAGAGGASSSSGTSNLGALCKSDDDCVDAYCVPRNDGNGSVCCATPCSDEGPNSCLTNGMCDPGGSSCALYPAGTFCGAKSCVDGMEVGNQCDAGVCGPGQPVPCPGGLACEDVNACKTSCQTKADCAAPGSMCPLPGNPFCVLEPAGAECKANAQCMSQVCGTSGQGHCCATACDAVGAPCGATDCDAAGNCVFPNPQTSCGTSPSCTGAMLTSEYCDGVGSCSTTSETKPCGGDLVCSSPTSCFGGCDSNDVAGDSRCAPGHWCSGPACVPGEPAGGLCTRPTQCAAAACFFIVCF